MNASNFARLFCAVSLMGVSAALSAQSAKGATDKTAASATPTSLQAPFDESASQLPPRFPGHSILDIVKKIPPPPQKQEFEKTEEFDARHAVWADKAFAGDLRPSSVFAFEINPILAPGTLSIDYSADAEEFTVKLSFEKQSIGYQTVRWLESFYSSKNLGSRLAITRMGVKFRVTSFIASSVGVALREPLQDIEATIKVPLASAKMLKAKVVVFAVVKLVDPFSVYEQETSTASLDRPEERLTRRVGLWASLKSIWIVNRETGELLRKIETFPRCKYDIC